MDRRPNPDERVPLGDTGEALGIPGQHGFGASQWDASVDATLAARHEGSVESAAVEATCAATPDSGSGGGEAKSGTDSGGVRRGASVGARDPMVGRTLHHFRIMGCIGVGGMGRVYRAHDLSLDRPVALKVIAESVSRDSAQRDRFVREARAQAKLTHPNVVSIYYVGEHHSDTEDGQLFFAMELVEGEALDAPLARGERMAWPEALSAALAAGEALKLAHHRGVVHRDVKPSNLLRDRTGLVKIADFGLAKTRAAVQGQSEDPWGPEALDTTALDGEPMVPGDLAASPTDGALGRAASGHDSGPMVPGSSGRVGSAGGDAQLTRQGALMGSPLYMSPEQADGQAVDHRSDMYSLGATLFHLVAGRPVFEAKSASGVIGMHLAAPVPSLRRVAPEAGVPERVDRLVQRLLAKRPEDRFATWEEVLSALREAQPQAVASAGFWVRGVAFFVDQALVAIPMALFGWAGMAVAGAYFVLAWWLWGASLGKWLFRLRVRTDEHEKLTLPRALLRLLCQYWFLGLMVLMGIVGYGVFGRAVIDLGDPDLAPHRWVAILMLVVISFSGLAYFLGFLWAGIRRHKAAWHDLWSRTRVVYDLPESGGVVPGRGAGRGFLWPPPRGSQGSHPPVDGPQGGSRGQSRDRTRPSRRR